VQNLYIFNKEKLKLLPRSSAR